MSNPYDPNAGQYPTGGGGGFGGGSYPANPYGDSGQEKQGTDPVSIVGFVLSLTCCLSIVGAILGFVGLGRTKPGRKKGRWAAISAIIIGILGTLAGAGIIVAIVFFANSVIQVDQAEVGQCANVSTEDDESIVLTEAECDGDHDGEIVYVGEASEIEDSQFMPSDPDDLTDAGVSLGVCTTLMDPADVETIGTDVEYTIINEDSTPEGDEPFFCLVRSADGEKLTEGIL